MLYEEHPVHDEPKARVRQALAGDAAQVDGGGALHAARRRVQPRWMPLETVAPVDHRHIEGAIITPVEYESECGSF